MSVQDVAEQATITYEQVREHLAGLTTRLKNPKYGFAQSTWPVGTERLPGGVASYRLPADLVPLWRHGRGSTGLSKPLPAGRS